MEDKPTIKKEDQREIEDTVELHKTKIMSCYTKDHQFIGSGGRTVKCAKCGIGYILSIGSTIDKGHIYINGQLAI